MLSEDYNYLPCATLNLMPTARRFLQSRSHAVQNARNGCTWPASCPDLKGYDNRNFGCDKWDVAIILTVAMDPMKSVKLGRRASQLKPSETSRDTWTDISRSGDRYRKLAT
jgi:hypothetical protein